MMHAKTNVPSRINDKTIFYLLLSVPVVSNEAPEKND